MQNVAISFEKAFKDFEDTHQFIDQLKIWVTKAFNWVGIRDENTNTSLTFFDAKPAIQQSIHTVLVPVVEHQGNKPSGRLRNLLVKTVGKIPSKHHELTRIFSVISGSQQTVNKEFLERATNHLIDELELNAKQYWQATASFEYNDAWHSGNSADLAMAGLFFCSILEAMDLQEQFRLNPAIAITGELTEKGEVVSVSTQSLKQKVEGSFSWTQVMVVPQDQLGDVYRVYEELKNVPQSTINHHRGKSS